MKKLILSAAFAAALASPAFAQSYDPELGSANVLPPQVWQQHTGGESTGSFAYAPRANARVRYGASRAQQVDTDPNIALRERIDAPDAH